MNFFIFFSSTLLVVKPYINSATMNADIQQAVLGELQGDGTTQGNAPAAAINIVPVGMVDPPEAKKRAKRPSDAEDGQAQYKAPGHHEDMNVDVGDAAHKRKHLTATQGEDAVMAVDVDAMPPKPKKKRAPPPKKVEGDQRHAPATPRKQPGYAMIKAEDDRLRDALAALLRKRTQREAASDGRALTSTCGVLTNNLIDFYDNVVASFHAKFGRYIA